MADEIGQVPVDTTEIVVYSEYGSMWIVDSEKSRVSKYTAGGDKILSADHDFGKPVAVANHIDEYFGCYVADHDADEILKFDAKGELMTRFTGIPNVVDLAIHDGTGTLWAVSVSDDDPRLTVINTFTESEIATVKGLQRPVTIVINQTRGDVWIADIGDTDRIVQIKVSEFLSDLSDTLSSSFAETHDGNFDFDRPIDPGLAILDAPEATLYFTDTNHNEVERLIFNNGTYDRGTPVSLETGVYPSKVEVSPAGDVWVLGLDGSIWTFDEESTSDRTPVSEFNDVKECLANPRVMVADHTTGNVWIADNGTNLVFEITISDTVGVKIGGFEFVEDLVINK
ncbi:MAG: hypothetical protein JSU61_04145 [Fidelibacterota bacterium]|nr:MAG: hypothetical protein JSU61_04145 [Candidatus Neomarinimicrobiota bacterium]